jgi:hypothetical protein
MEFWSIVLGIIAVVLLLAWRSDRKRKGRIRSDIWKRTDTLTGQNMFKGQDAEQGVTRGINQFPRRDINQFPLS